jgi:hypothetical protein
MRSFDRAASFLYRSAGPFPYNASRSFAHPNRHFKHCFNIDASSRREHYDLKDLGNRGLLLKVSRTAGYG